MCLWRDLLGNSCHVLSNGRLSHNPPQRGEGFGSRPAYRGQVCKSVLVEPLLAPVSGKVFRAASANIANDARADIKVRGFLTRAQDAFVDVRGFFIRMRRHMQRNQLMPFSSSTNGERSWNTLSVSYMSIVGPSLPSSSPRPDVRRQKPTDSSSVCAVCWSNDNNKINMEK